PCHTLGPLTLTAAERPGPDGILDLVTTALWLDKRRQRHTLTTLHALGDDLPPTRLDFDWQTGRVATRAASERAAWNALAPAILAACSAGPLTEQQIWAQLPGDHNRLAAVLRALVAVGWLTRQGQGRRG